MISVEGLKVEFGVKPLFSDVTFVINDHDKIALVGKNGAGKSTLLKILCGKENPTFGKVFISNGLTIGYLPQVMPIKDDTTVLEETSKAFSFISQLKEEVSQLEKEISLRKDYNTEEYLALVDKYTIENERYLMLSSESQEKEVEKTLLGLGFLKQDFLRQTSEFSGGWRMRIELAKILLERPDVLLLDEPTNHLDIESIQWLEGFLCQSAKAVVVVSHDRAFINKVTKRTLEISCGKLIDYKVSYDEYVKLRKERRDQQLRAWENQQKEIQDIKDFIERFRYKPTKAVQVQSRIKQLEKIVPIEVDKVDTKAMRLKFPPCQRSGDFPLIIEDVRKDYDTRRVFDNVNLTIRRGEKVAFVGKNGEGKTTLVKCIMNEIPFSGQLKIGHNVMIGYFAQNQAQLLDEKMSVFETIDSVAKGDIRFKINDILGAFMFAGEASDKKVKILSGGERSRLAMIKLLLEPVNFLILDEPTNHLDMDSKDVLKHAISSFDGTAIIVSHDREFLDGLVTKIYEFGEGRVKEYMGGIYDFLKSRNIETLDNLGKDFLLNSKDYKQTLKEDQKTISENKQSYLERKDKTKKLRKAQKMVLSQEEKISEIENRIKELDALLCQEENASNMTLVTEYTSLTNSLSKEIENWETLSQELEAIKEELN